MSGPARAGVFVYALHMKAVARFYQEIAVMEALHERDDMIVLQSSDLQLLVRQVPAELADEITIEAPPIRREKTALKFFFTVPSICVARECAESLGGTVCSETWDGPGFIACNAMDPEGNVFQVRESV